MHNSWPLFYSPSPKPSLFMGETKKIKLWEEPTLKDKTCFVKILPRTLKQPTQNARNRCEKIIHKLWLTKHVLQQDPFYVHTNSDL